MLLYFCRAFLFLLGLPLQVLQSTTVVVGNCAMNGTGFVFVGFLKS